MKKTLAVLISDIHFTVATLELATQSLKAALADASERKVPLVIAGDTLDGKAIIRGECANRLIELLKGASVPIFMLVGNHDLLNEKANAHALNFLKEYVTIVDYPQYNSILDTWLIPYQNNPGVLQCILTEIPNGSRIIMHQGVQSAYMGHYVQDKTSLPKECFADYRVISGHYHRAQEIKCGRARKGAVGLFSYIGNPYTLTFGEAEDGPKGYQILTDDGLMEQVPLNLRRHRVFAASYPADFSQILFISGDPLWIKIYGTANELAQTHKKDIAKILNYNDFKLDKICTDAVVQVNSECKTDEQLLDALIDGSSESEEQKVALKSLWRDICGS